VPVSPESVRHDNGGGRNDNGGVEMTMGRAK